MAQHAKSSRHHDVIIFGSNLNALLIAEALHQSGRDVQLFEASDRPCPHNRPLPTANGSIPSDLEWFPASETIESRLSWLSQLLRIEMPLQKIDLGPVHFDEGRMKSFVGFGDRSFQSRDELDFYVQPQVFAGVPDLGELAQQLATKWSERIHTRHQPTRFILQDQNLSGVEINGDEIFTAHTYITCAGPSEILSLFPNDTLDSRTRVRLAKASTWSLLSLHLMHSTPMTPERALHVLYGSGQDFEPILGRFWPVGDNGKQVSVWQTLIPRERDEDTDFQGQALKQLKRQIKRAYETFFDSVSEEKLLMVNESRGYFTLKSSASIQVNDAKNLYFASHMMSPLKGVLGAIDIAHTIATSLEAAAPQLSAATESQEASP